MNAPNEIAVPVVASRIALDESKIIWAGALEAHGLIDEETAPIAAGTTAEDYRTALNRPDIQTRIQAEAIKNLANGKAAELRATLALDKIAAKVAEEVDSGSLTISTEIRVGEFLLKVSGLEARRLSELRTIPETSKVLHHGA